MRKGNANIYDFKSEKKRKKRFVKVRFSEAENTMSIFVP